MNPFDVLGLPARADLTDQQVQEAWRAIAIATHPDRPGGDAAPYAAAAAAYAALRTPWARSEALADLLASAPPPPAVTRPGRRTATARLAYGAWLVPARVWRGRPGRLALRVVAAVVLGLVAARSGAGGPASAAVVTGLAVWLVLTGRGDLAPPPGR